MHSTGPGSPRRDALWKRAVCVGWGLGLAGIVAISVPPSAARVAAARALGIISEATRTGYDQGRDLRAYVAALVIGVGASTALWWAWTRRDPPDEAHGVAPPAPPCGWREIGLVALLLVPGLLRFDLATNGWDVHYTFFAEEGQAVAWAQVLLGGGVLGRDAFASYGPLAIFPVAWAFELGVPSVWLWRMVFYVLEIPALFAGYVLLRELTRTRWAAVAGLALLAFHRLWPFPGFSWSLLRVAFGLAALAALARFLRRESPWALVAVGALCGLGILFSQEAGAAAVVACGVSLAIGKGRALRPRHALALGAGFGMAALPVAVWFTSRGGLADLTGNLLGFGRLRMLGHAAMRFPDLPARLGAWIVHPGAESWALVREALGVVFGPALLVGAAFHVATRMLRGGRGAAVAVEGGLVAYGALLFVSPLSRPDPTHVIAAIPPVYVLTVVLVERLSGVARGARSIADRATAVALMLIAGAGLATLETDTVENTTIFAHQVALNLTGRGAGPAEEEMRALELPRAGGIRLPAYRAEELEQVVRHLERTTGHGEAVWCFPAEPMINFLADRPLSNRFAVGLSAITRQQRLELLEEVSRRGVRRVVVNTRPIDIDGIPSREQLPELWPYVESRYVPEATFGRFVVMRAR